MNININDATYVRVIVLGELIRQIASDRGARELLLMPVMHRGMAMGESGRIVRRLRKVTAKNN